MQYNRRIKYSFLPKSTALIWFERGMKSNLPKDARITGFFHDWSRDALGIYIYSEEFSEVPEGEMLEYFELIISE